MNARIDGIIEKVRGGNRDAFGDIVREFQSRLRTYIRVLLWDAGKVDDLAQETFIKAYTRIDTYDPARAEFYLWLKGIARNLAANENRRCAKEQRLRKDYLVDLRTEFAFHVSDENETSLDRVIERVRTCLERLPARLQRLFRDFYFDQQSLSEIAEAGGKSAGAVKMSLLRGRLALRQCIERAGESP